MPASHSPKGGGGGLALTCTASMGILGGDWVLDRETSTIDVGEGQEVTLYGDVIAGQSEYELHTDIDLHFTMSGQTDTGLTFGASIDLDECPDERKSPARQNDTQVEFFQYRKAFSSRILVSSR